MKTLIVLLRLDGGVGRANREIAKALVKKGYTVDILSREDDLKKHSFLKGFLPLRKKVKKLIKEKKYDIIYAQDYSVAIPLLLPYPLSWKKFFYCSIGVKREDQPIQKLIQDVLGKLMGRRTIVIFDHNKKRFPKAHVVYRGVNPEDFKPLKRKREYFGWINKFSEQVDSERYERIAKDIGLKPLPTGVSKKKTKSIDKAYGKKIVHSFNIPPEEMNKFFNKCKVFINLATPDAGFNLSWLEAMSAGVPIVIGNNEGAGPIMPFDKILDEKDMEKRVKEIMKNPKKMDYRKWLVNNGFTWERVADELLEIFKNGKK